MKNPYYYKGANPTVDLIVVNPYNEFLLVKRKGNVLACPSQWAFAGGFINTNAKSMELWEEGAETPKQAALREAQEETGLVLENPELMFVGCFEGNNRDPRDNEESWSKSFVFIYVIDQETYDGQKDNLVGMDDVEEVDWKTINEINELALPLAFDHREILDVALKLLVSKKPTNKM